MLKTAWLIPVLPLLGFEVAGLLLLAAMVGAVALVKRDL